MSSKRTSTDDGSGKAMKQQRLNFGQKMAPKGKTASGSTSNKAGPSKKDEDINSLPSPPKASHGFTITEKVGDIFDAPDGTVIIHACNCFGSWGAGIAAAFKKNYPKAFPIYNKHCKTSKPADLVQTALLIPPVDNGTKHWVGCLFTSKGYGRARDKPSQILEATTPSMKDLMRQMEERAGEIKEIRMCQINSGLFAVPWEKSKEVMESLEVDEESKMPREIIVYSLSSE